MSVRRWGSATTRAAGLVAGIVTAVALAGCGATIAAPSPSQGRRR